MKAKVIGLTRLRGETFLTVVVEAPVFVPPYGSEIVDEDSKEYKEFDKAYGEYESLHSGEVTLEYIGRGD